MQIDDLLQPLRKYRFGRELRRSSGPGNDGRRREDDVKKELGFPSLGSRGGIGEEGRKFVTCILMFVVEEGREVAEGCW